MISNLSIQGKFPIKTLRDVADFLDSRRRPITASDKISALIHIAEQMVNRTQLTAISSMNL